MSYERCSPIGVGRRGAERETETRGSQSTPTHDLSITSVKSGFTLQPDLQFVMRPGGGLADEGGRRLKNATVMGLRATINY